jgi:hypothetical protein
MNRVIVLQAILMCAEERYLYSREDAMKVSFGLGTIASRYCTQVPRMSHAPLSLLAMKKIAFR